MSASNWQNQINIQNFCDNQVQEYHTHLNFLPSATQRDKLEGEWTHHIHFVQAHNYSYNFI